MLLWLRREHKGEGGGAVAPCVLRTTLLGGAVAPLLLLAGGMEGFNFFGVGGTKKKVR